MTTKVLVILRGIPGSGKSTYVQDKYPSAVVCSADNYFSRSGEYKFDPRLLGRAHGKCRADCKAAMERKEKIIIVDNTNTKWSEFKPYRGLAKTFDYITKVVRINCSVETAFERNIHSVPLESIRRMAGKMKPWPGEEVIDKN